MANFNAFFLSSRHRPIRSAHPWWANLAISIESNLYGNKMRYYKSKLGIVVIASIHCLHSLIALESN